MASDPIRDFLESPDGFMRTPGTRLLALQALDNLEEQVEALQEALTNERQTVYGYRARERELQEQLQSAQQIDRSEWREGIVSVYDHEGHYVGCMGSETWQWTLEGGIARLKEQLETARTQLHAEQRDRNWWAANNSRERQQLRERSEMLERALRRAQAIARRGVGPDTTPEQALETIDGYIDARGRVRPG